MFKKIATVAVMAVALGFAGAAQADARPLAPSRCGNGVMGTPEFCNGTPQRVAPQPPRWTPAPTCWTQFKRQHMQHRAR